MQLIVLLDTIRMAMYILNSCLMVKQALTRFPDLCIQEHPLWSTTSREFEICQACTSWSRDCGSGWLLRSHMCSSAYQGAKTLRPRCELSNRPGLQPVSGWNSSPVFQSCVRRLASFLSCQNKADAGRDCLFLDLYVPGKAISNPSLKLPVISWFYGGAYIFGSKDQFEPVLPFYAGRGLVQQSDGNVIFVSSN